MALLKIIDGPSRGRQFSLTQGNILVGRDDSCALSIPDGRISRRHLQIVYDRGGDQHVVVDVGSSNGVAVNGSVLKRGSERVLQDGDEIGIGDSRLRYSRELRDQDFPALSSANQRPWSAPNTGPWSDKTQRG